MTSPTIETTSKPNRVARTKRLRETTPAVAAKANRHPAEQGKPKKINSGKDSARATKQDQVLTLLKRSGGATIDKIMQATDWQQHSVRGFLSGTVKKKLGLTLTSSKDKDGVRRYRIETRRTR
mgnify:CR=1 FL=1